MNNVTLLSTIITSVNSLVDTKENKSWPYFHLLFVIISDIGHRKTGTNVFLCKGLNLKYLTVTFV